MKKRELKTATVARIVREYESAASEHLQASENGNYKLANRKVHLLVECYRELRKRGEADQKQLLALFSNSDDGVRLWAATHGLGFAPAIAESVLEELEAMSKHPIIRTGAHYTLDGWRQGTLKLP